MNDSEDVSSPLARVPSGVVGVGAGLVMGAVIFGLSLFLVTSLRHALVFGVVFGALLAIAFTILAVWAKRRAATRGVTLGQRIGRATRSGRVPDDAQPHEWIPQLALSRQYWKTLTIIGLTLYPAIAVLDIVALVGDPSDWRLWAGVIFFAALTAFSTWQGRRQLRQIRIVREQLEGRHTQAPF